MISASTPVLNTLKQALAVKASPRVTVEWNQNRYTHVATVDNWGYAEATYGYDLDIFPIAEIVKPVRPTSGILLGKTGEGVTTSGWSDQPDSYRTYTASPTSKYKYWTSPVRSDGASALANTQPYILYANTVWTNKIYVCFETSWASPVAYHIDVTTDGTNWTTVSSNVAPNAKGVVSLYRQSDGSWSATQNYANPTKLLGVRVVVTSMSRANAHLNLIELGLRVQDDLSPYLISYDVDTEVDESDFISPLGTANTNTGNVSLSNLDGRFNNDTVASDPTPLYRGMIDMGANVYIDLGIDSSAYGGTAYEYIRMATMVSGEWSGDDETSTIQLVDQSKYLLELNPAAMLMTDVTIGQAIWRMLDSVGFTNFQYTKSADESATIIPFFWTDPTKTVWETIQTICRGTQTAAYFDANGILQIKSRSATFDKTKINNAGNWTLDYALNGTKQPDIIDLTVGNNYEANHVTVHYKPTGLAVDTQGRPISEVLWQPGSENTTVNGQIDTSTDVVLRSSALALDMTSSQMYMVMSGYDAAVWPFEGMANIRGELVRYKGKQYRYIDKSNNWQYTTLYTTDDKLHVDNDLSSPTLGYQNYFTGRFELVERGYDWTTAQAHDTTIQSWINSVPVYGAATGTQTPWSGGLHHYPSNSLLRVTGRSSWQVGTIYTLPHGAQFASAPPNNMGTRFRFPSNPRGGNQVGGIFWYSNAGNNVMYMLDIASTRVTDSSYRSFRDEVALHKRDGAGLHILGGRGVSHLIAEDTWYDLDINLNGNTFSVFLNGQLLINITDSSIAPTGRVGLYTKGYTVMDFEYFYEAAAAGWPTVDTDNSSYLDLIQGGYYSDQFYKDGFYMTRKAKRKSGKKTITYKQQYAQRFFDEFGILIHEVRPYTVTFDKVPVTYSDLYFSNSYQSVALEYTGNPFGAKFTLANASRHNAVLNGDDAITFGSDNVVNQKLMITGRTVQQQDEKTIEVKDDQAILKRGDIPLDFSSDWIQTPAAAQALANWITSNWATPADQVEVNVFGNPLFELSDVVGVNFPLRNMASATHQYFVTKVSQSYGDGGLSTSLSLRRARP